MDPKLVAIMAQRKQRLEDHEQDDFQTAISVSPRAPPRDAAPPPRPPPARPPPARPPSAHPPPADVETPRDAGDRVRAEAQPEADARGEEELVEATRQEELVRGAQSAPVGVGMTLTERHPFTVVSLRAGGPAAASGQIQEGDELTCVQGEGLGPHLTGAQVCACVCVRCCTRARMRTQAHAHKRTRTQRDHPL